MDRTRTSWRPGCTFLPLPRLSWCFCQTSETQQHSWFDWITPDITTHFSTDLIIVEVLAVLIGVLGLGRVFVPEQLELGAVVLGPRLPDHVMRHGSVQDLFHHGQMLPIVVGLEERVTLFSRSRPIDVMIHEALDDLHDEVQR